MAHLTKPGVYDIQDTNIALLGSDACIPHILTEVDVEAIVRRSMQTYKKTPESKAFSYDLHFWLGRETTQDEAGTAAYKTVELDDHLYGIPVQYREAQGSESPRFLSYFPTFLSLKGGVSTGFHHVSAPPPLNVHKLYRVSSSASGLVVREVAPDASSLVRADVYLLDLGNKVWQFNSAGSVGREKFRAAEFARGIAEGEGRKGECEVVVYDENGPGASTFLSFFGSGTTLLPPYPAPEASLAAPTLHRLSDASGTPTFTPISPFSRDSLSSSDAFILDHAPSAVYVWLGKDASLGERRLAGEYAQRYLHASHEDGPFDFHSGCVRSAWSALLPFTLVVVLAFFSLPLPLKTPHLLKTYLTLDESEGLTPEQSDNELVKPSSPTKPTLWHGIVFVSIGLLETLAYLTHGSYLLITSAPLQNTLISGALALSWAYTLLRTVTRPTQTVPYDLFAVYITLFAGALIQVGGVMYDHAVFGDNWPNAAVLAAQWINLGATAGVLGVVLGMPLALPGRSVNPEEIGLSVSPEDYTSLFGWITFSWVYPLVQRGRYTTLSENDVWALSPTIQSRSIFTKFVGLSQPSLLRKLFIANSLDLFLDFFLTVVSVVFNYASPFFLKRILDAIDSTSPTPESRAQAYIYAVLAFVCSLCKSQADVQHLWCGRRASTRMRSELMASIYDKALKRKDFSGIVDREKKAKEEESSSTKSKSKKDEEKSDEAKAGADVGKIVNLMAGDANRVSNTISGSYFIYGAPFEILIASIFLYNLLGISAFAGFVVLLLGWPLNSFIARRSVRIQKGLLGARDRRMGVLSELMGAVKFIKFFAWEEKWIDRVMEMRAAEMRWMVKGLFFFANQLGGFFDALDLGPDIDLYHLVLYLCDARK
ncbi:hypothetical protein C0991_005902 [Blastosporella zonata]|nr:hypothetical protein C0991_005902 [Blastosporella zonata]